jgi:hypothetical protein
MPASAPLARLFALVLGLCLLGTAALPAPAHAAPPTAPELRQAPDVITARFGISPGEAHQDFKPGTDRRALERLLPELFQEAMALGVRIDSVSVGRGFYRGDKEVETEIDLDLVVTGMRQNVLALAGILGQRWDQSLVYVWEIRDDGETLIALGELTSGLDQMSNATLQLLGTELPDGGHLKYAGSESLLVVANVGDSSEEELRMQLARVQGVLERGGVRTGRLLTARAKTYELTRANYQQFIDAAQRGKSG